MVFIKAAFDNEIRKIAVESDISYSDLVQKLLQVFPSLGEQNPDNILLFYRDADGDNISFCSDTELRTALEHVGTDNTIRVLIAIKVKESTPSLGLMEDFFGDSWSDPFFQHGLGLPSLFGGFGHHLHHHPIGAFFSERQQALRDREEQLRQQRLYEEKVRKAEIERRKALMQKAKQAREERMKHLEETRRKSQELTVRLEKHLPFLTFLQVGQSDHLVPGSQWCTKDHIPLSGHGDRMDIMPHMEETWRQRSRRRRRRRR